MLHVVRQGGLAGSLNLQVVANFMWPLVRGHAVLSICLYRRLKPGGLSEGGRVCLWMLELTVVSFS